MANDVLAKMAVKISAQNADFNRAFAQSQRQISGFQTAIKNVAKAATGLFAADQLIGFGKAIFNTTAEFQKFEAVLTNTLGSNSAAKAALSQITEFAIKTPFQVNELTASFVKLSNQGFIPTVKEMTALGDLAAAMGKSFDQLTEAIIDAQTGEFERLKEFGIRAQKQGDQVTFTFKGVKKQVDFTADSIREYILSLGEAKGVTGGMEAQSKTLGGGLSNLKDQWEQLALAIGASAESGGALSKGLDIISQAVSAVRGMFDPVHRLKEELKFFEKLRQKAGANNDIEEWAYWNTRMVEIQTKLNELTDDAKKGEIELAAIREKNAATATKAAEDAARAEAAQLLRLQKGGAGLLKGVATKTGADFLFDSGALTEMSNAGANALRTLDDALEVNSNSWDIWWAGVQARTQQASEAFEIHQEKTMQLAEVAQTVGTAMGDVFGQLATNQQDVLQTMMRATQQIIEMFLQQSIAGMIAAAIKDPSMPFPFGKIAIAAAGIGAVKALFNGLGASSSAGSGGGGTAPGRTPSQMGVKVSGRIRGYDIALSNDKESYRRSRMG